MICVLLQTLHESGHGPEYICELANLPQYTYSSTVPKRKINFHLVQILLAESICRIRID